MKIGDAHKGVACDILIIEDDLDCNEIMYEVVRSFGFEIATAFSVQEGLDWIKRHPEIKLVISDFYLGDATGFDFILAARQHKLAVGQELLGVIIVSGQSSMSADAILKAGALHFFSKPVDFDRLRSAVMSFMEGEGKTCGEN
jgi:DNA-binding NtrC family response regulator